MIPPAGGCLRSGQKGAGQSAVCDMLGENEAARASSDVSRCDKRESSIAKRVSQMDIHIMGPASACSQSMRAMGQLCHLSRQ